MQKVNEQMICSFANWSPAELHFFPTHASPEYQSLLNCIYITKHTKHTKNNKLQKDKKQNNLQSHASSAYQSQIASLILEMLPICARNPFLLRAEKHNIA